MVVALLTLLCLPNPTPISLPVQCCVNVTSTDTTDPLDGNITLVNNGNEVFNSLFVAPSLGGGEWGPLSHCASLSFPSAGSTPIWANYSGNNVFSPSSASLIEYSGPTVGVGGTQSQTLQFNVNGQPATGTFTWNIYDNPQGTGTPLWSDTETLVNGQATSAPYDAISAGAVYWIATFVGSGADTGTTATRNPQALIIEKANPAIAGSPQPGSVTVGGSIADAVGVSAYFATGTVTFNLYAPGVTDLNTPVCTKTAPLTPVSGSSGYTSTSASCPTSSSGTYQWVATYNGDGNNSAVSTTFGNQPVVAGQATPAIHGVPQNTTVTVGGSIVDKATVSSGFNPTGSVTFHLYNNANGQGISLFNDTENLGSGGVATSASYTTAAAGSVYWVATYNGDGNNNAVSTTNSAQQVVVSKANVNIVGQPNPSSVIVGNPIAANATVSGGYGTLSGTVTFFLYNTPNAQGNFLFRDANEQLVNGVATSKPYTPITAEDVYWVATYNGDSNNNGGSTPSSAQEVIIGQATPNITCTPQPATATVGSTIAAKATVTGGYNNPTGTVTWNLYNNALGQGTPLFTDTEALFSGTTSKSYTTRATGTFYWVATYNGDGNNAGVSTDNGAVPVIINDATPGITPLQQPATLTVGGSIAEKATLTGGYSPTGSVTFNLYDNANGEGPALFTAPAGLSGNVATSASYTTSAAGTFYWVVTYDGDSNNNKVSSGNGSQPVTVNKATVTISGIQQPTSVTVGGTLADTATVSGGYNPTGDVTFTLYNNATGTAVFTDANEPLNSGFAQSNSYTTVGAGAYYWVATYNGDSNNGVKSTSVALQPVTVSQATPTIVNSQQPVQAIVGSPITDQATVTGGYSLTGTVTFKLYDNPTGTGNPLFTDANEQLVDGVATSKAYTPTTTEALYWIATYNGDANNKAVSTANPPQETVAKATPTITGTPQPGTIYVGLSIADSANVTGGDNATGTVTFNLYNNAQGTGSPLFTDTEPLVGGGATSKPFTTSAVGTVYWVATYNGDSNNAVASTSPAAQPVTVTSDPVTTTVLTASPSGSQMYPQPITLTANVTSATAGTISGTVTFTIDVDPTWNTENVATVVDGIAVLSVPHSVLPRWPIGNVVFNATFQDAGWGVSSTTLAYKITANTSLVFTCDSAVVKCNPLKAFNSSSFTLIAILTGSDNRSATPPSGTVQFSWNNSNIGPAVPVVAGKAILVVNSSLGAPFPFAVGSQLFHAHFDDSAGGFLPSDANLTLTLRAAVAISVWNLPEFLDRHPTEYALPSHTKRANDLVVVEIQTPLPTTNTFHLYAQRFPLKQYPLTLVTSMKAKSKDPLVNFTLPWGVMQQGEYLMLVNVSADNKHLAASFQFRMLFHLFPAAGRYVLPETRVSKGDHLTYYSVNWEVTNNYPIPKKSHTFLGWTSFHSSILKCNYTQVLDFSVTATSSRETYEYLGLPLVGPANKLRNDGAGQYKTQITKFAVIQTKVSKSQIGKQLATLPDGPLASGTVYGTYCISLQRFPGFR